jgi:zinc transport system ATP-binding protein
MSQPVIEIRDVSYSKNGREILSHVDLVVNQGDFYAIIGPNGGGKTTLLRIMLGLIPPGSGNVAVFGRPPDEVRDRIGYVPQFKTFDFSYPITVREMIRSGLMGHGRGVSRRISPGQEQEVDRVMESLGLSRLASQQVGRLSGGEQQRAIVARALVGDPDLLVLDEPTVYVDAPTELQFLDLLDVLRRTKTLVMVTHDIGVLPSHVNRIACLNHSIFTHGGAEITDEMLAFGYGCPVDLIAHGVPHRVLRNHPNHGDEE